MSPPVPPTAPKHRWQSLRRLAPVRLLVFFVVIVAGYIGAQLALGYVLHHAPAGAADWVALISAIALGIALLGLYITLVRAMEKRQTTELSHGASQALPGAVLGLVLFTVVLGFIHLAGSAQLLGRSAKFDVVPVLSISILAAIGEELTLRGAVFRIVEQMCGTTVALVVSAAIFGLLHAGNPGATVVSTAAIAIEAGLLLASAYLLTRSLWLPIGLHFGWNFTEGGVFGAAVSGGASGKGIFSVSFSGPDLVTGGAFGPEASVIAVAVCLVAAVALIVVSAKTGRWQRLTWRTTLD